MDEKPAPPRSCGRQQATRAKTNGNCCAPGAPGAPRARDGRSSQRTASDHNYDCRRRGLLLLALALALAWLSPAPAAGDQQWGYRRRHQRRLVLPPDSPPSSPASSPKSSPELDQEALKVAALAGRLEQWFLCRRLAAPTSGARCPAHFDGHLCWPPAEADEGGLRLACPRLLLPEEEEEPPPPPSLSPSPAPHQSGGNQSSGQVVAAAAAATTKAPEGPQERGEFARRLCRLGRRPEVDKEGLFGGDENKLAQEQQPQWEPRADYSKCPVGDEGNFDPTDKWIKLQEDPQDRRLFQELVDQLERLEAPIDPYGDPDLQQQWSLCIGNIMRHLRAPGPPPGGDPWCPIIFDGWRCWPSTRAAEVAYVSCPSNQPGFSAERKAHKICTETGQWYKHPMTNRYWSNYTTCVDTVDLAFRTKILNLYVIGNLISLVALTASLIIFVSFKSLKCTRVTIHKNLFLSFITNNLMWIIWYTCVVNDADLLQSNPVWHVLLHYFLVSNYFWMFCEGLYLHTLLVVAFVSEDKILKWFYLLGWLTPVPITLAYAYNRSYDDYYTNFCWMEESPYNLILMAPIGISLLLNLVFLINIVRVLVTKLRANNSPDAHQTRKAVRATLILIPLLGLHYILTPFRPEAKSEWEVIYESVAAVCTSFQGLCVALLFCFCNGEVTNAIKKRLKDTFNLQHSAPAEIGQMRARSNTGASLIGSNSLAGPHQHQHQHQPPAAAKQPPSASATCPAAHNKPAADPDLSAPKPSSLLVLANTNRAYLAEEPDPLGAKPRARPPELVQLLDSGAERRVRDCPV